MFSANLGDSMAMHYLKEKEDVEANMICKMHELSDPLEQKRIVDAGFIIAENQQCLRVYNPMNSICGINMTRSIGDFMFKMNFKQKTRDSSSYALCNEPEIEEFSLSSGDHATEMILLGCDGLWDGVIDSNFEIV